VLFNIFFFILIYLIGARFITIFFIFCILIIIYLNFNGPQFIIILSIPDKIEKIHYDNVKRSITQYLFILDVLGESWVLKYPKADL
jgi:hypothetical protein